MIDDADLKAIAPTGVTSTVTASHVVSGLPIAKTLRVQIFSSEDWELITEEYASSLDTSYAKVRRFGGSGDMGIDIACFVGDQGFKDGWENYQCKRYDHPLRPADIWVELGKIIYYSFIGEYPTPQKSFFCGSQGIGTALEKLLNDPIKLKQKCKDEWLEKCATKITSTKTISLSGQLLAYFDAFDFGIFSSKSVLEMVEGHSKTQFHAIRFGGGLPPRPLHDPPTEQPQLDESRYIRQLLDAYGEHANTDFTDIDHLSATPKFSTNLKRQRERFYSAEALRNFARDNVPKGTFLHLQEEIYQGVVDTCEDVHPTGFDRMTATLALAASISSTENPLSPATKVQDRQGICHQLANIDRLHWVIKNG